MIRKAFRCVMVRHKFYSMKSFSSMQDQLRMFQEYRELIQFEKIGDFGKAIPLYQRLSNVFQTVMSDNSFQSQYISYRIATSYLFLGKYDDAIQEIIKTLENAKISENETIRFHLLKSKCELHQGKFNAALETSLNAFNKWNDNNTNEVDLAIIAANYSMIGICYLCLQNIHEAESFLQLSARWSHHKNEQIVSYNNLGILNYLKFIKKFQTQNIEFYKKKKNLFFSLLLNYHLDDKNKNNKKIIDINLINQLSKINNNDNNLDDEDIISFDRKKLENISLKHAVEYWDEGLLLLKNDEAAMNNDEAELSNHDIINQTISFAISSAILQCNLSFAYDLFNKPDKSAECLANALQAINNNVTTKDSLECQPIVGKVLNRIADKHFQSALAISAEGLYNPAIEKLSSIYAKHDIRYQFELANALTGYGLLLKQWEKREQNGVQQLKKSNNILLQLLFDEPQKESIYELYEQKENIAKKNTDTDKSDDDKKTDVSKNEDNAIVVDEKTLDNKKWGIFILSMIDFPSLEPLITNPPTSIVNNENIL